MEKMYLKKVHICSFNSFSWIEGDYDEIESMEINPNEMIIGVGHQGHLLASLMGVIKQNSVLFLREKAKEYGTKKMLDGYGYSNKKNALVFVSEQDISLVSKIKCRKKKLVIFQLLPKQSLPKSPKIEHGFIIKDKNHQESLLQDFVIKKNGVFTLSSGIRSMVYYETLPAANCYKCILESSHRMVQNESSISNCIGLAYGGTFFSVFLSFKMGIIPIIYSPQTNLHLDHVIHFENNSIIIDDFISTGHTVNKLLNNCTFSKKTIYSIFAKTNIDIFEIDDLVVLERII